MELRATEPTKGQKRLMFAQAPLCLIPAAEQQEIWSFSLCIRANALEYFSLVHIWVIRKLKLRNLIYQCTMFKLINY